MVYFSRRRFIKTASLASAFLTSRPYVGVAGATSKSPIRPCFLKSKSDFAPSIQRFFPQIHPGADEFITEKYAAELDILLRRWSETLCVTGFAPQSLRPLISPMIVATQLAEATVVPLRAHGPIESEKLTFPPPRSFSNSAFLKLLHEYFAPFRQIQIADLQIGGIDIVSSSPLRVHTTIHYDYIGQLDENRREERTGEWELDWLADASNNWSISRWLAGNELRSRLTGKGFVDISASCFEGTASYTQQMQYGLDHWRTVLDGASGIDIYGNNGISAGDFDGDGWDDIYVCQPAGLPDRLYRNRGDGTFEDVTDKAGVGVLDATSSALFADLNNNGHQDLIVVRTSGPLLFINRGDGTFEFKPDAFHFAKPPQGTFTGIAAADYDRDGLLDIYFCLYSFYQGLSEYQYPQPYYDAQNGPPNFLLRNRGDHTFEDVTSSSGLDKSNNRYSFDCGWGDYNNDGWPDLYVVNDFGRKVLYKNNGDGTFSDVSAATGVENPGEGMSMTWLDYDNDGFDDIYVLNMWVAAGKRVTTQEQFLAGAPEDVRRVYRQDALGNCLLHNKGGKDGFLDATDVSGARFGGWNWSTAAWDFDHDGYPDIYVANGFISGPRRENLSSFFWRQVVARSYSSGGSSKEYEDAWNAVNEFIRSDYTWSGYQRNNLFLNNRNGSFAEASGILGLDCIEDSRSFALLDLDHDGRLEVALKNRNAPQIKIFHNQLNPLGPAITFSLKGTKSNRDAIGALIELQTAEGRQRNTVRAGSGFLAQNTKTLCFGLGSTREPVRAIVHWPSGTVQAFENLPLDHHISIKEGLDTHTAVPFNTSEPYQDVTSSPIDQGLFSPFETWLVDPILAPDFTLPDMRGKKYSLRDFRGHPLMLVFWSKDCSESPKYLASLEAIWPSWKQHGLQLLAVQVNSADVAPLSAQTATHRTFQFPTLNADDSTTNIYSIFHRYLFERRLDMTLPTTFLLNADGEVVKVYSGIVDPSGILSDVASSPRTRDERLRRALPFAGHYFGAGFHHNYFTYGVAFLQYGYLDQALTSFQEAVTRNPAYAAAYYNIGLIYLNKSQFNQARQYLEKTVELDPSNVDAWNNLGVVYGQQGDYVRALDDFLHAVQLQPANLLAVQNLVKLYDYQNRQQDAQAVLEKAISHNPDDPELHIGLAMCFVQQNDMVSAKREFERTIQLSPQNTDALNGLGVVLMKMGDSSGAMKLFEQCRRLAPEFDRPYLNMAVLYLQSGDRKQAHDILAEYLRAHPDNEDVHQALQEVDGAK